MITMFLVSRPRPITRVLRQGQSNQNSGCKAESKYLDIEAKVEELEVRAEAKDLRNGS